MSDTMNAATIREDLRVHLADVLYCGTEEITDEASFKDLGLDSVLCVELVAVINEKYALAETLDSVYEHPTLTLLADHVLARAELVAAGESDHS